jgi:hypothetical protein
MNEESGVTMQDQIPMAVSEEEELLETTEEEINEVNISELTDGDDVFLSTGKSRVKVTKDGKVRALVFRIKSTGIADLVDQFNRKAPTPPVHKEIIAPDSEIGKQMGLRQKKWVKMPDLADPDYIRKKEKHDQDLGMAILLQGLDVVFRHKNKEIVTDPDEQIKIMKQMNMTGDQFMQIINDIQDLTRWNEEATEDFFEDN